MGIALEEAPAPEAGNIRINGEVPDSLDQISQGLEVKAIRTFLNRTREVKRNSSEDEAPVISIPDGLSSSPHQVLLENATIKRDLANRRFLITFGSTLREKFEENKTVSLSFGAAIVVAGGIYAVARQIRK